MFEVVVTIDPGGEAPQREPLLVAEQQATTSQ